MISFLELFKSFLTEWFCDILSKNQEIKMWDMIIKHWYLIFLESKIIKIFREAFYQVIVPKM